MASPQASQKLLSNLKVTHYDFDPDATTATDVAWVDMRDYENFAASFFRTVGTGGITYKILANAKADGSGTDVVIKQGSAVPDAAGDYAFLECTAEEIAQEAADAGVSGARYVSLNITFATATDEGVVTYIRGGARHAGKDLTADSIA